MKITIVSGARPNFMKIAPICRAIDTAKSQGKRISYRLVYTGTEHDPNIDASLFFDLAMPRPDAYLGVTGNSASRITGDIMVAFEQELDAHPTDVVMVVDDLTATMSCSIVAKKRGLKVAHLTAGTRSFDMNMPREVNRTIADAIADFLFSAGPTAIRNLNQEGMILDYIHYVGNILIDNIRFHRSRFEEAVWWKTLGLRKQKYLLLTLNRRDLLGRAKWLKETLEAIIENSEGMPVVAPLHAYAEQAISNAGITAPNLHILPTQSYLHFGYLINHAKGVITDSGNIAEEATFLDVPCITLNSYAEHPETWKMGTNQLVGDDIEALKTSLQQLLNREWKHATLPDRWDGRTAERIVQILLDSQTGD